MAQAGPNLPRRALFAAAAFLPIAGAAIAAPRLDPLDAQFLAWEAELQRLEAAPLPDDGDQAQAEIDRCGCLAGLIVETRSTTVAAARAKLRQMLSAGDAYWAPAVEDVLTCLAGR